MISEQYQRPRKLHRNLRAAAAFDRDISRAIDRLERLQRCRKGEAVLPPVNVRLTRRKRGSLDGSDMAFAKRSQYLS
jgi:hypothetical protein